MGRCVLVFRLASRDIVRRPAQAALLLVAILAATTTLTLGLVLHGETSQPYAKTRAATKGPDVVANVFPAPVMCHPCTAQNLNPSPVTASQFRQLVALTRARGVVAHSGPYPVTWATLTTHGLRTTAEVEGRDAATAAVDQPKLVSGGWVRPGGVVVERTFAEALNVGVGDKISLNGRSFAVVGIAVTAAFSPYPEICSDGCFLNLLKANQASDPGLVWVTREVAQGFATPAEPLSYFLNLELAHPDEAVGFANIYASNSLTAPSLTAWQWISQQDANLVKNEQRIMLIGSWLLGFMAIASVAVLVGVRMADQMRRVGLLKAVGGTPALVAAVLLAEYLVLALLAAAAGVAAGWLLAPLLANPGAGMLGTAGAPPLSLSNVVAVIVVALVIAVVATLVTAVRAARTSTVRALADSARQPRRSAWLIGLSAKLPVPLLLALHVAGRRPRRVVLCAVSVAITVSGIVAVMIAHARLDADTHGITMGLVNPRTERLSEVMLVLMIMLGMMAAVNLIVVTWSAVLDGRRASAVVRALGATPDDVASGLSGAQVLSATAGAVGGVPGGFLLYAAVSNGEHSIVPPVWWLATLVIGTVLAAVVLTGVPARFGARRPVAEVLQAEGA
ncbi:MAG TPA: FtsX-like permease family protein [Acidimicrobiales bacterium]|nr:FtsX-like permease family protein [Acidimicrobiales bacterium]